MIQILVQLLLQEVHQVICADQVPISFLSTSVLENIGAGVVQQATLLKAEQASLCTE